MNVRYRAITSSDYETVSGLVRQLYQEDPAEMPVPDGHFERTFIELSAHADKGTILVIEKEDRIIGYSVLIHFWSNELGGNVLTIDELYVVKECRGQGVGTGFVQYLVSSKFNDSVALQLEVTSRNARARRLYENLGFSSKKNETMQQIFQKRLR